MKDNKTFYYFICEAYGSIIYSKIKIKTKKRKLYYVTIILQTLHWPVMGFRIKFKFCTMFFLA